MEACVILAGTKQLPRLFAVIGLVVDMVSSHTLTEWTKIHCKLFPVAHTCSG